MSAYKTKTKKILSLVSHAFPQMHTLAQCCVKQHGWHAWMYLRKLCSWSSDDCDIVAVLTSHTDSCCGCPKNMHLVISRLDPSSKVLKNSRQKQAHTVDRAMKRKTKSYGSFGCFFFLRTMLFISILFVLDLLMLTGEKAWLYVAPVFHNRSRLWALATSHKVGHYKGSDILSVPRLRTAADVYLSHRRAHVSIHATTQVPHWPQVPRMCT